MSLEGLAAVLAVSLACLSSCGADAPLAARLERLAADHVGKSVDLSVATPFPWDELAVFPQYFPKPMACGVLGLSRWDCFWLPYPRPDDGSPALAVFLNGGRVVRSAQLPRCGVELRPRTAAGSRAPAGTRRFTASRDDSACKAGVLRLAQD
jgi:hypothetical protein